MKSLNEILNEDARIDDLRATFYFRNEEFFQTLTDPHESKHCSASFVRKGRKRYVLFYDGDTQIGFLTLTHKY